MFEERFNRAVDRLWAWCRWQAALIGGRSRPKNESRFQPSIATGALLLAALAYQVVSGGLLLLYYQPSVYATLTLCGQAPGVVSTSPAAWCSTYYVVHSVPMGAILLTSHLYGAYVVVFLLFVHLFRGFYAGAYRQPGGKSSWMVGTLLLLFMLGMGFTGYLLAYTQLSYNATEVSITLLQALPGIGPSLASLVIGDGTPQSLLSRVFALHVVVLPVAIALLVFLHKRTPLFPGVFVSLAKWGLLYVGVLIAVASAWLWPLPAYAGSSGGTPAVTVPAWYFLWVFKLVDFVGVTPAAAMVFIAILVLFFLFLPFLDRSRRSDLRDRPVILFLGNSLVGFFILMTAWGDLAPGVPVTPAEAALRLGPLLAGNALAVAFFFLRYRRTAPPLVPSSGKGSEPSADEGPELPPGGRSSTDRSGRRAKVFSPALFSVMGLVGSLFLLGFGWVLPTLFLVAAFLVHLAETARSPTGPAAASRPSGAGPWVFPLVGFSAVLGLWIALVLAIAL